ncbi:MAG: flagellar basal body-associated FliL family protein [Lachnospiraceae bacterium]|nr:flagellar basal body-associated FliL family protein [Lachnospiraceae bacterium]
MRKNLISVIILALCIVNLVLNALMVFVFVPSIKKTDNLVTEIAAILNLELEKNEEGDGKTNVAIADAATYNLSDNTTIPLKNDGSGTPHYAVLGISISMDSSSKDYATVSATMANTESWVVDVTRGIVQDYTYAEIQDAEIQNIIKQEIVNGLNEKYQTDIIYDINFSTFITQ